MNVEPIRSLPKITRLDRLKIVTRIRDAAMTMLRANQEMRAVGGLDCRCPAATVGDIDLMHRTPFQRLPTNSAAVTYTRARLVQRGQKVANAMPYGLDIWYLNRKVLSVQWSADDREFETICFKRGPWEQLLLGTDWST